jgi:hypothetical protein
MSSAQGFARGVGLAQRNEALRQAQERTQLSLQREQRIAQAQARQNQLQAQHRLMQMVQDENFSGVNFMTAAEIFGVEPQAAKQIIEVGKIITATKDARARQTQAAEAARGFQLEAATNLFSGQLTPEEQAGAVSRIGVQQQQLEQNPLVGPEAAALGLQRRLAGGETQAVTAQVERRTKRQEADITRRREFQDFVDREAFLDKRGRTLVERLINQGEISPGVPLPESTKVALRQALLVEELLEDGLQATQLELSAAERKDALDQTSLKLSVSTRRCCRASTPSRTARCSTSPTRRTRASTRSSGSKRWGSSSSPRSSERSRLSSSPRFWRWRAPVLARAACRSAS